MHQAFANLAHEQRLADVVLDRFVDARVRQRTAFGLQGHGHHDLPEVVRDVRARRGRRAGEAEPRQQQRQPHQKVCLTRTSMA